MAYVSFTDGTGAATLTNGRPDPANRFRNWKPDAAPVESSVDGLGTGAIHQWAFRTDYFARFEIDKLPASSLATAIRLKLHLMSGGSVTVATTDSASNSYTCTLRPGTVPEIEFSDPQRLRYTMTLELKNASAAPMTCTYAIR